MTLKKILQSVLEHIPWMGERFQKFRLHSKHSVEWALIHRRHNTTNTHPSILHFSVNKGASQYVQNLLTRVSAENGMTPVHLHGYAFNTNFPFLDHLSAEEMQKYVYLFNMKGYTYSNFGGAIEGIPNMESYRTVLMVRDPRDVLTSLYFSSAYSHPVPARTGDKREAFLARRAHTHEITIDQFVLENAERVRSIYHRYTDILINKYAGIYLTRYEEMTVDFDKWFNSLLAHCQLEISPTLRQTLYVEAGKIRPTKENIYAHVRKGEPGDYLSKLQPETTARLNEIFSQVLKDYKYA